MSNHRSLSVVKQVHVPQRKFVVCLVRFYRNILDICYDKFASKLDVRREITLTSNRGIQIRTLDIESIEKYFDNYF